MAKRQFTFLLTTVLAGAALCFASSAAGQDRSEQQHCATACHKPVGEAIMPFTAQTWLLSAHANSREEGHNDNTYCARCHSPFQADPLATHDENEIVPLEDWQAITCGVCHPPHAIRVANGTPLAIYTIGADPELPDSYTPVPEEESNTLCESCHSGSRHAMYLNPVKSAMGFHCVQCHMPAVDLEVPVYDEQGEQIGVEIRPTHSHDFDFHLDDPASLREKVEAACMGCHAGAGDTTEDVVTLILSGVVHNDRPAVDPGGPYGGLAGQPIAFEGSATDEEGDPLTYEWDFGDGAPPVPGPSAVHTFAAAGTYLVSLTVSDSVTPPVTKTVEVVIETPPTWRVRMGLAQTEAFTVSFLPWSGYVLAQTTWPDGRTTTGVGLELGQYLLWINGTGEIYYGWRNSPTTMQGLVLGGPDGTQLWFAERQ